MSTCGNQGHYNVTILIGKERARVKNYLAPELKALDFVAEEAVSAPLEGSNTFNDGELEW